MIAIASWNAFGCLEPPPTMPMAYGLKLDSVLTNARSVSSDTSGAQRLANLPEPSAEFLSWEGYCKTNYEKKLRNASFVTKISNRKETSSDKG